MTTLLLGNAGARGDEGGRDEGRLPSAADLADEVATLRRVEEWEARRAASEASAEPPPARSHSSSLLDQQEAEEAMPPRLLTSLSEPLPPPPARG